MMIRYRKYGTSVRDDVIDYYNIKYYATNFHTSNRDNRIYTINYAKPSGTYSLRLFFSCNSCCSKITYSCSWQHNTCT